ncbi:MAG TPA: hypothetical protein ENG74_02030 [Thermoplasmatales archaeon]|nr:hypothetical protein [Thermoplasmatales archaeon]
MVGLNVPLWLLALIVILVVYVGWKILKFAIKIFLMLIALLLAISLLDYFNVFSIIRNLITGV